MSNQTEAHSSMHSEKAYAMELSSKLESHSNNIVSFPERFPPELDDRIIDHLHDDHKTLFQASLICKEWLPAIRSHLFSRITINPSRWSQIKFRNNVRYLETVASHVRSLLLTGSIYGEKRDQEWLCEMVLGFPTFTAITTLHIFSDYHSPIISSSLIHGLRHLIQSVVILRLDGITLTSKELRTLVSIAIRLRSLLLDVLVDDYFEIAEESQKYQGESPPKSIEKLSITAWSDERLPIAILRWFLPCNNITHLELDCTFGRGRDSVARYLRPIGGSLLYMKCKIDGDDGK